MAETVKTKLFNLQFIKDNLELFIDVRPIKDVNPAALFSINLDDDRDVKKRIDEITDTLITNPKPVETAVYSDPLLACAFKEKKLHEDVIRLVELQRAVDSLRLKFLMLDKNKRQSLLTPQIESLKNNQAFETLNIEKESAVSTKSMADKSVDIAEHKALTENNQNLREIAAKRVLIEKFKSSLSESQIRWISDIEQQTTAYHEATKHITTIEGKSLQRSSYEEVKKDYKKTLELWRSLVDKAFKFSDNAVYESNLPEIPAYPGDLLETLSGTKEADEYKQSYDQAKQQLNAFLVKSKNQFEEDFKKHYTILLQTSQVRSKLLQELIDRDDNRPVTLNQNYFLDVTREVKIVPFRWLSIFYVKIVDVKQKIQGGFQGILVLSWEIFKFLTFMTIPFFFWLGVKKIITNLNKLRIGLINRQYEVGFAGPAAIWIQRLLPYIPWLLILPAIKIAENLITNTFFSEMGIILPYILFYSYYRIFRLLIAGALAIISLKAKDLPIKDIRDKIHLNAWRLGMYLLVSWSVLYTIESIVSQGLIYRLSAYIVFYFGVLAFGRVAAEWKNELVVVIRDTLPGLGGDRLARAIESKYGAFLCLGGFIILAGVMVFRWLSRWSERFDYYKQISARIFRRKLESTASKETSGKNNAPPESYRKWFPAEIPEDLSLLILPQNDLAEKLSQILSNWEQGISYEHSAAIYGDKGTGKTCLLLRLRTMVNHIRCISVSIPPRFSSRKDVLDFFEEKLQIPLSDGFDSLMESDKDLPKTFIAVDDAHNLFHSKLGGFEGFKAFLELVNAPTVNLFWCAAFNRYAWNFLFSVFGKKPYINTVMPILPWLEADIKKLIMTRHHKTDFHLSYDDILQAVGSQDRMEGVVYAESNFFRLLWQQAGGNPRAAIHLWLSSMKHEKDNILKVGLPETPDASLLKDMPDDSHFVFTQIVRHENLSETELVQSSNLSDGTVRHSLKIGLENRILEYCTDKRYRITISHQRNLINYLQAKNFIYGNE